MKRFAGWVFLVLLVVGGWQLVIMQLGLSTIGRSPTPTTVIPEKTPPSAIVPNLPTYGKYAGMAASNVIAAGWAVLGKWKDGHKPAPVSDVDIDTLTIALNAVAGDGNPAASIREQLMGLSTVRSAALATAALETNPKPRQDYASAREVAFLKQGMDVSVRTGGVHATTLTLSYVLMGRPTVFNLVNDSAFMGAIDELGFKTVIFTDGYDHTWTYDVKTVTER